MFNRRNLLSTQYRHNTLRSKGLNEALKKAGFTLIEVIIFLVILSIAASMMITFFGDNFVNSTTPIIMLQDQYNNNQNNRGIVTTAENIIADYNQAPDKKSFNASGYANYDSDSSQADCNITDINATGTTLTFSKVVLSKEGQKIIILLPKY